MARVVEFANSRGYDFSIEKAKRYVLEYYRIFFADNEQEPTEEDLGKAVGVYYLTNGYLYGLGRLDGLDDWGYLATHC
jgi:hypothetical protein